MVFCFFDPALELKRVQQLNSSFGELKDELDEAKHKLDELLNEFDGFKDKFGELDEV